MDHAASAGDRRRGLDAQVEAFSAACARRVEQGASLASHDTARLTALAGAIAETLADWGRRTRAFEAAGAAPFAEARAATLILESVFDEVLTVEAWRLLAAALDRALAP